MSKYCTFKNKTEIYIETGSYQGDSIQLALDSGFKKIYSIELCPELYEICKNRFLGNSTVELLLGDSSIVLKELLAKLANISLTFWLDGHYSGPHTARGAKDCPLMEEIEAILTRSNTTRDLIYIDDMRIYRDFNSDINEENMIKLIKLHKTNFQISYEDSIYGEKDIMIIEY